LGLSRPARFIATQPQEFTLVKLLAQRQGEVIARAIVTSQVWDMNFDSDTNVVEVAVKRLRAKIDKPFEKKLLHTVRGMGYVMEERPSQR
jgi:two-component system copper resistance phosphate regulon response regulator CusR